MPSPQPLRKMFMKNWFAVEAIPMYVVIGGVISGAGWYLYRLALGPSVVWTKSNPTPWNTIGADHGTKLLEVNQKFDRSWSRDKW